jgi:diguanylate cyclase (GGDEF)-like protein
MSVRGEDTVCRYGGDEFLYLLVNPNRWKNIEEVAAKVFDCISQPLIVDDLELSVKPSIGIAVCPEHGCIGDELLMKADAAMYRAKEQKARYVFFDDTKDHSRKFGIREKG